MYRKAGAGTYYTRIGRRVVSCGTTLKTTARAMEAWIAAIEARHDLQGVLAAIVAKRLSLVEAYRLGEDGVVARLAADAADAADTDVRPYLAQWVAWRGQRTKGKSVIARYEAQITRLYPDAVWRRSTWTAAELTRRLDALTDVSDPTRNRYRAACSAFGRWLVRQGVLTTNPARDLDAYGEHPPQVLWLDERVAQRLLMAVPQPYRLREAFMVGAGMDWSDTARLTAGDVDCAARTVRCHGSKTLHRNRVVRITEAWTLPILREGLAALLPTAPVCHGRPEAALKAHKAACVAVGVEPFTLHGWRHHYAVTALRRGERPQVVAHQLGHGNTTLVLNRYGKYLPSAADYVPDSVATDPATIPPREAVQ